MSAEDQYAVNYACTSDDRRFIQSPQEANARRIDWIYKIMRRWWDAESEEAFLELLEGKEEDVWLWIDGDEEEDVWLWIDGDEEALPELELGWIDRPPYALAAKALQTRQASGRFESREMAEMRQRMQSEGPEVRLAAIAWLALTSKAVKRLDSKYGRMDREEWDLWKLTYNWYWLDIFDLHDQLPEASTKEFEKAMEKEGHTCHTELLPTETKRLREWLYVQSVLFPERAGAAVNLMVRDNDDEINCKACRN